MTQKPIDQFIAEIPPLRDLRERLSQNVREGGLLRKLIRLAESRDRVEQNREAVSR